MKCLVWHRIEDDLTDDFVERFAAAGLDRFGVFLAKHAAFDAFCALTDAPAVVGRVADE